MSSARTGSHRRGIARVAFTTGAGASHTGTEDQSMGLSLRNINNPFIFSKMNERGDIAYALTSLSWLYIYVQYVA